MLTHLLFSALLLWQELSVILTASMKCWSLLEYFVYCCCLVSLLCIHSNSTLFEIYHFKSARWTVFCRAVNYGILGTLIAKEMLRLLLPDSNTILLSVFSVCLCFDNDYLALPLLSIWSLWFYVLKPPFPLFIFFCYSPSMESFCLLHQPFILAAKCLATNNIYDKDLDSNDISPIHFK